MFLPTIDFDKKFFVHHYEKFRVNKDHQPTGPFVSVQEFSNSLCNYDSQSHDLKLVCLNNETFASILNNQLFTFSS